MKTIRQIVHFEAKPVDVYAALMDPVEHAEFTGDKAVINPKINGRFEVYDGYAAGTFTGLKSGHLIECTWKELTPDWPAGHYSKVKYVLKADGNSTKLEFTQKNVPDDRYDDISQGWQDYYWEPLAAYFKKQQREAAKKPKLNP